MADKILISPIALKYQKPVDIKECYIELFENHLYFKMDFYAEEPIISEDEASGWDKVYNHYEWVVMKRNIAGIEKSLTKDKKWAVYIIIQGFNNDLKTYYRTHEPAKQLFDKLQQWLIA